MQYCWVFSITLILGACSILYELLIAHTLSTLAANTVVWYSLTIGLYLFSLGVGSIFCNKIFHKKNEWQALFLVEILLSLFGALSVALIHMGHMMYGYYQVQQAPYLSFIFFFGISFFIISAIGFLSGLELPLLIGIANNIAPDKKVTNRVLGMDYLGSLVGGISFPYLALPLLGILLASFSIATLNLAMAFIILLVALEKKDQYSKKVFSALFLGFLSITAVVNHQTIEQYFLKKYYYLKWTSESLSELFFTYSELPKIKQIRSKYQKIDFVPSPVQSFVELVMEGYSTKYKNNPFLPKWFNIFMNGDFQLNANLEEVYHEYFAHIPIILNKNIPEKVLVLGAGDGLLLRELLKYEQMVITHVDLDPKIVELAQESPLQELNNYAFENNRVQTIAADGFQYIRNSEETYDAIYIDFPAPKNYTLSKLYSKEFYYFVHNHLHKNGFIVFDAPGIAQLSYPDQDGRQTLDANESAWPFYENTLKAAGFSTLIPYVTNLEIENPNIASILQKVGVFSSTEKPLTPEQKKSITMQVALDQKNALQYGFIMAKKETGEVDFLYIQPNVNMNLLNEKRFNLAFAFDFPITPNIDDSLVNSIMRPTLPNTPLHLIRLPF